MSGDGGDPHGDDPHGDRAWLAAQREKRAKGRKALLDAGEFSDWPTDTGGEPDGGGDPGADGDGEAGDDAPSGEPDSGAGAPKRTYRSVRHPILLPSGEVDYASLGPVPDDCPVVCLGRDGKIFFFLTPGGQLVSYEDGKFGKAHITALFAGAAMDWLLRRFPAFSANGAWTGFKADYAQIALFSACDRRGVFDAREKVRGLGCWRGEDGELIQHLGNEVRIEGRSKPERPGMIGEFVYPGRPKVPPPVADPEAEAAKALFADFQTWSWSRGELDARLLLGWIGCAILGAALDWRPMVFMTGDAGTGKSSLQERIKKLLPGRLASTVDASPAALRQIVNQDAIGVSFDEIEADMNTDQAVNVMKLARVAASGGTTYRGGKDHNASEFTLRGCFAFSAIVPPSMRAQDMQRLTFLRLQPLKKGGKIAHLSDAQLKAMGQKLVGRIVEGWPRWTETLETYERALQSDAMGHNQRGAKQFGTLLAAAHLLLFNDTPTEATALNLSRGLARDQLYEYEGAEPTWLTWLRHVLSAQPAVWQKDGFPTVAEVVRTYLKAGASDDERAAQRKLNRAGLALVRNRAGHVFLAIPRRHQQVSAMFRDTDLRAAGGDGAWTSVFRGAPTYDGATATGIVRVDKVPQLGREKCTQLWLGGKVEMGGVAQPIFDLDPEGVDLEAEAKAAAAKAATASTQPVEREPGEEG